MKKGTAAARGLRMKRARVILWAVFRAEHVRHDMNAQGSGSRNSGLLDLDERTRLIDASRRGFDQRTSATRLCAAGAMEITLRLGSDARRSIRALNSKPICGGAAGLSSSVRVAGALPAQTGHSRGCAMPRISFLEADVRCIAQHRPAPERQHCGTKRPSAVAASPTAVRRYLPVVSRRYCAMSA